MEGARFSRDIVHVLMNIEITVTFYGGGAYFLIDQILMEGACFKWRVRVLFKYFDCENNYFFFRLIFFFSFSPIFLIFLITSNPLKGKTTASSIPAWSPTAVLTGPFHA